MSMLNPLGRLARRDGPKSTLRERAATLKAKAADVMRQPADQPEAETLPQGSAVDHGRTIFTGAGAASDHPSQEFAETSSRDVAATGDARLENVMGRHETFETGTPLADALLTGTMLSGLQETNPIFPATEKAKWLSNNVPASDAALLEALDDLNRLDAAQTAILGAGKGERDTDTIPGYSALEDARWGALERLGKFRAETEIGMEAKMKALLSDGVVGQGCVIHEEIAESLARDIFGFYHQAAEIPPDPILTLIEQHRTLLIEFDALDLEAGPEGDMAIEIFSQQRSALDAALKTTVPTTAAGLRALMAWLHEYREMQKANDEIKPDDVVVEFMLDVALNAAGGFQAEFKVKA